MKKLTKYFAMMLILVSANFVLAQPKTLTILHTNDIHGFFVPREALWNKSDPKKLIGGFKELAYVVDSIRAAKTATILLDAGDVMTGNPICDYMYDGAYGGALFAMMNMIKYDGWEPGNHDFDISQENLARRAAIAKFPTINANITGPNGEQLFGSVPYVIIEKDGLKIGVIGAITRILDQFVKKSNLDGLKVLDPIEAVQKYVNKIESQTDLIIVVTHEGVDDDSLMAMKVKGIDVIVGGHSHTRLRQPVFVNGVVIVQAGSYNENLGVLDLTVENHKVKSYDGKLIQLWCQPNRPNTPLSALVDSMQAVIDKDFNVVIGTLDQDWKMTGGESNIGNYITDAQRKAVNADVGFTNDFGIRQNALKGPLTRRKLREILPFINSLVTFEATGAELRSFINYYVKNGGGSQTSGIRCVYDKSGDSIKILSLEINGKPIDDAKKYTCVCNDYFYGELENYTGMKPTTPTYHKETIFEVVEKSIIQDKIIVSKVENRIAQIERSK